MEYIGTLFAAAIAFIIGYVAGRLDRQRND